MSDSFYNLPRTLQRCVDDAFNLAATPISFPSNVTANAEDQSPSTDKPLAGGFILDEISDHSNATHQLDLIPLSLVPRALSYLNIPADDEQIMAVFRNAASGWSLNANGTVERNISGSIVSRDDWRSICTVLLELRGERPEETDDDSNNDPFIEASDSDGGGDSEYHVLSHNESSGDECVESTPRRRRKHTGVGSLPDSSNRDALSERQRAACLEAFSLFFALTTSSPDLPNQQITKKDVQHAADVLGEKLTTNEIVEMLEMFSSSSDKSLNLTDFGRMMVAANLL